MEIRTPPADHGEGVLETVAVSHYRCRCEFDVSYCRRFNYPIVNYPRVPLMRRDTEVVSSPLVEQQQEDGQRHHSAGTLSTHSRFAPRITPRENHVFS